MGEVEDASAGDGWRTITLRGVSYAGENVVRLLLTAAAGVVIARYLGPEGLGLLSYVQAVFGLLLPIVLLGLPPILVREVSAGRDWREALASTLAVQAPVAAAVSIIGFLIIVVSRGLEQQALLAALVLTPIPLLTLSQSLRSYLEATGRSRAILLAGITASLASFTIKLAAVAAGAEIWVIALAGTVEAAIVAVGLWIGVPARARLSSLRKRVRVDVIRDLTRESWPLLLSSLAVIIYMRVDVLMLGVLADDFETGVYSAAARLSEVWYFLPTAAVAALRPRLSRLHAASRDAEYKHVLQRFLLFNAAGSYIIVVGILILGPHLIRLLYGPDYSAAGIVLQLHVLATPFVFIGVASSPWFVDRRLSRTALLRSSSGALANIALNLVLIPRWGAQGAAVATLISYALSGVLMNGFFGVSRPVFALQIKAFVFRGWRSGET